MTKRGQSISKSGQRRGIAGVSLLVEFAREQGIDDDTLLANAGIRSEALADHRTKVSFEQELTVVCNLTRLIGDDPIAGLRLGMRHRTTSFGVLGLGWLCSRTIGDVLSLGTRYIELTMALTRVRVEHHAGGLTFSVEVDHLPEGVRRFLVHRDAAAIATVRAELTRELPTITHFCIRGPAPSDCSLYRQLWGVTPEFNASQDRICCTDELARQALSRASELTLRACIEQCELMLARLHEPLDVARDVQQRLHAPGGVALTMDAMADSLAISARTLRRQLRKQGTSYRDLLDTARATLAKDLLRGDAVTLSELADRLGYADTSSFVQSFRRLTGTTPMRYREQARA